MIDWDKPDPASDTLPGYAGPPVGFLESVAAARKQYDAQRLSTAPTYYAGRLGKDVVAALKAKGRTGFTGADGRKVAYGDNSLRPDYVLHPTVAPRIWADVEAERARDPGFLKSIGSAEEFDAAIVAARRKDFDESSEVLGRASPVAGVAGELAGGFLASLEDPLQLGVLAATAALPAGRLGLGIIEKLFGGRIALGTATKIASEALGNAVVNVTGTVPTLPVTMTRSEQIGVPLDARAIALELGSAAIGGLVLGAAPPAAGAAFRSVRKIARELRGLERPLTVAEQDALAVLDQAAADIAASPFVPTPEGDAAHSSRLTEAVTALEQDRPVDPAVFDGAQPVVKEVAAPGFDPTPHLAAAEAYLRDRKAGPPTPEALGAALDIGTAQAHDVISRLLSGTRGRQMLRISYDAKSGKARYVRPMQRRGAVDLITQLADMGGVRPGDGHDLIGTIGQRFVGGAGQVFRKGGMSLNDVGEFLMQNGWVRANETGNGIPTEAEVIDLIDRAMRAKMYHPEEAAGAMATDRTKVQANDGQLDEFRARVAEYVTPLNEQLGDASPARLTDDDITAIAESLPNHETVEDAVFAHWERLAEEAEFEARAAGEDGGFDDYLDDVPFGGGEDAGASNVGADRAPGSNVSGQPVDAGNAGQGEAGSGGIGRPNARDPAAAEFDAAAGAQALEAFDTPQGDGPAAQVEALAHDLRAEVEAIGHTATGSLGLDAEQAAPAGGMTEAQRTEMAVRLQQSQVRRGGQQSVDQISGGLFDAGRDQLDAFAMPDGSVVSKADLLAEIDADDAAIATLRDCL